MNTKNDILGTGTAAGTTVLGTTQTQMGDDLKIDLLSQILNIPWTNFTVTVGGAMVIFGTVATLCFLIRSFRKDKN